MKKDNKKEDKVLLVSHPKMVFLIVVYNEEKFILKTLQSIQKQTYRDFKVLISDNNSTDKTQEICESFVKNDERFFYYRHDKNYGSGYNSKFIFKRTHSEYVQFLGAHDIIAPIYLEKAIKILDNNTDCALYYSKSQAIYEDNSLGNIVEFPSESFTKQIMPAQRYLNYLSMCSGAPILHIFRRKFLYNFPRAHTPGGDLIILAALASSGYIFYDEEILFFMRHFKKRKESQKFFMERLTGKKQELTMYSFLTEAIIDIEKNPIFNDAQKASLQQQALFNIATERRVFVADNSKYIIAIEQKILDFLNPIPINSKISLYGCGEYAKKIYKVTSRLRKDIKILYFLDTYKEDLTSKPKIVNFKNFKDDIDYIVIASSFASEIKNQLKNSKLEHKIKDVANILNYYFFDALYKMQE